MDTSKKFYVGIEDSKEFRRNLLEGSKSVVSILRTYHKILYLRNQKEKQIALLNTNLKEIKNIVKHLDEAMPDMGVRASKNKKKLFSKMKIEEEIGEISEIPKVEEITNNHKNSFELRALEDQLKDIDSKLNNI